MLSSQDQLSILWVLHWCKFTLESVILLGKGVTATTMDLDGSRAGGITITPWIPLPLKTLQDLVCCKPGWAVESIVSRPFIDPKDTLLTTKVGLSLSCWMRRWCSTWFCAGGELSLLRLLAPAQAPIPGLCWAFINKMDIRLVQTSTAQSLSRSGRWRWERKLCCGKSLSFNLQSVAGRQQFKESGDLFEMQAYIWEQRDKGATSLSWAEDMRDDAEDPSPGTDRRSATGWCHLMMKPSRGVPAGGRKQLMMNWKSE